MLASAVECAERARDRASVTNSVEQVVVAADGNSIDAAVVRCGSHTVGPEARVERFAAHRHVCRGRTRGFEFILHKHHHHTVVGMVFLEIEVYVAGGHCHVVHAENHQNGVADVVAAEFYLVVKFIVRLAIIRVHAARLEEHRRTIVKRSVVERNGIHQSHAADTQRHHGIRVASHGGRRAVFHSDVEITYRGIAAVIRDDVLDGGYAQREVGSRAEHTQRIGVPEVIAGEIGQCAVQTVACAVGSDPLSLDGSDARAVIGNDDIRQVGVALAIILIRADRNVFRAFHYRAFIVEHLDDLDVIGRVGERRVGRTRQAPVVHDPGPQNFVGTVADREQLVGKTCVQFAESAAGKNRELLSEIQHIRRSCG